MSRGRSSLVQRAADDGLDKDYSWLIEAHLLLRRHGQELCKNSKPECRKCPLAPDCDFYQRQSAGNGVPGRGGV
jgi:endonuclease III